MSEIQEVKKDFTAEVALTIPAAEALAELGQLDDAIAKLMDVERSCRLASDFKNLKEICISMVKLCHGRGDWNKLNATIAVLAKKRAQSKVAIGAVVELAYTFVDSAPTPEVQMEFIKTLTDVCEGKMYVEAESARLKLRMAKLYEQKDDLAAAVGCIQDVHVETYGTLSKAEKVDFILHQVRLNLLRKDFVRTMIQSRKMSAKMLDEEGMEERKIQFNTLMVEYHLQAAGDGDGSGSAGGVNANIEGCVNTWQVAQCYYNIFDTAPIRAQPEGVLVNVLHNAALFLLLTAHGIEQQGMLNRMLALKVFNEPIPLSTATTGAAEAASDGAVAMDASEATPEVPTEFAQNVPLLAPIRAILRLFAKNEIIPNGFPGLQLLRDQLAGVLSGRSGTTVDFHSTAALLAVNEERLVALTSLLRIRVIQHNIRVVAGYYKRISMTRLSSLMDLSVSEIEAQMAELASNSDVYLRIDRPNGVVSFAPPARVEDTLNAWNSDVTRLLSIMEATSHLISRENMVYKIQDTTGAGSSSNSVF